MSNLNDNLAVLKSHVASLESELNALRAGKKASAPKARLALQKIKVLAQEMRKSVMLHVKSLPVKSKPAVDLSKSVVLEPEPVPEPLPPIPEPQKKKRTRKPKTLQP